MVKRGAERFSDNAMGSERRRRPQIVALGEENETALGANILETNASWGGNFIGTRQNL
jgi:hypothetical protein